ncbi:aldo/keto reductase [Methanobacterium petrolearium]|uniref:aldo/keto reductase n=1 Tax=Methanobacterium petrolearium TaxID=710190 RepID=UPI001AE86780|nr:aldo/keto reductase [Methanobacterium petrolearium]MBP1946773.1 putative aldo/keto reductase-like oxidoreductase [Methanobacterium petrolearium]BDZ69743.1 aldo/keto reductase [Methanobacterium petrolearium]
MLYRDMGSIQEKISILGMGCMRLPTLGSYDRIDTEKATQLLDYALDQGINYVDTAYPYHGLSNAEGGASELFLGEYFTENDRCDEVYLSTKLPTWLLEDEGDMDRYLDEQLKRLKTDQIDFYLLHSVKEKNWFNLDILGIFEFLDSARADGRIKYVGFSSHDEIGFFKEVVDSYQWDMCMIQYNYLDENIQAGKEGLQYATDQGMGVAVMEPLKGGVLAEHIPPEVKEIWDSSPIQRKPAEWALRYLWDIPEISTVLSGMTTMEQLRENLLTAEDGLPNSLTSKERKLMEEVKEVYQGRMVVDCSRCGYCMPCPSGINIPQSLSYLNQAAMLEDDTEVKNQYYFMLKDTERAGNCLECGLCEELCSQHISIREKLKQVARKFGN